MCMTDEPTYGHCVDGSYHTMPRRVCYSNENVTIVCTLFLINIAFSNDVLCVFVGVFVERRDMTSTR